MLERRPPRLSVQLLLGERTHPALYQQRQNEGHRGTHKELERRELSGCHGALQRIVGPEQLLGSRPEGRDAEGQHQRREAVDQQGQRRRLEGLPRVQPNHDGAGGRRACREDLHAAELLLVPESRRQHRPDEVRGLQEQVRSSRHQLQAPVRQAVLEPEEQADGGHVPQLVEEVGAEEPGLARGRTPASREVPDDVGQPQDHGDEAQLHEGRGNGVGKLLQPKSLRMDAPREYLLVVDGHCGDREAIDHY
mmetsp:Transcript_114050/g.363635  ORF Transcript_114050/g.363635 Transcript_114050/m.363635 type:complete len:250 (+) Transcript_114050:125-874(+)